MPGYEKQSYSSQMGLSDVPLAAERCRSRLGLSTVDDLTHSHLVRYHRIFTCPLDSGLSPHVLLLTMPISGGLRHSPLVGATPIVVVACSISPLMPPRPITDSGTRMLKTPTSDHGRILLDWALIPEFIVSALRSPTPLIDVLTLVARPALSKCHTQTSGLAALRGASSASQRRTMEDPDGA